MTLKEIIIIFVLTGAAGVITRALFLIQSGTSVDELFLSGKVPIAKPEMNYSKISFSTLGSGGFILSLDCEISIKNESKRDLILTKAEFIPDENELVKMKWLNKDSAMNVKNMLLIYKNEKIGKNTYRKIQLSFLRSAVSEKFNTNVHGVMKIYFEGYDSIFHYKVEFRS